MEDQGGMGSPVLSLEGFFQLEAELPERIQALMRARKYAQDAVREENEYWARLSSTVLCDEVDPAQFGHVQEEFKEYARHWALYGSGVDVITDFQAHMNLRADRVQRNIDRKMRKEAKLAALQASNAPAATSHVDCHKGPDLYEDGVVEPLPFDPNVALSMLEVVETTLRTVEDQIVKDVPQLERDDREMFTVGFTHMMQTFSQSGEMRRKYGAQGNGDRNLASSLKVGNDVPSYFANVSDGSIFRRKVLSMAGLRNLIIYGPMIYVQLRDLHFSGDLEAHPNDAGLKLMRRVTGNVVDLDTTVLRCTDMATLNAINASNKHKGLPVHAHSDAFASSPQAQEIATNCAVPLLEDFARACGITTTAAMQARRIDPKQISRPIPVAGTNTDRGKHPVWQYVNAGQNSFHANVPTMADVNGALLKAPFHCLRAWLKLHALHTGDELKTRIADFFEHCVVDSCFNGKWKSIEEYNNRMAHEGTIVDVLQRVQMKNQAIFTADFFDNDNDAQDNEVAEMTRLAAGLVGRDKSGVTRGITGDDVRAWVQDPSVTI